MHIYLQRDELKASLQQVTLELEHANQTISELSSLRLQLQAKKEEILTMQSKLTEEHVHRCVIYVTRETITNISLHFTINVHMFSCSNFYLVLLERFI